MARSDQPPGLFLVERSEYGALIGEPVRLAEGGKRDARAARRPCALALPELLRKAAADRAALRRLEKDEIGGVNYEIERVRLSRRKLDYRKKNDPAYDDSAARAELAAAGTDRPGGLRGARAEAHRA